MFSVYLPLFTYKTGIFILDLPLFTYKTGIFILDLPLFTYKTGIFILDLPLFTIIYHYLPTKWGFYVGIHIPAPFMFAYLENSEDVIWRKGGCVAAPQWCERCFTKPMDGGPLTSYQLLLMDVNGYKVVPPSYVCWFIIPLTSSIYLPWVQTWN